MDVIEDPDEKCLHANGIKYSSFRQLSDASVTLPRKWTINNRQRTQIVFIILLTLHERSVRSDYNNYYISENKYVIVVTEHLECQSELKMYKVLCCH